MADLKANIQIKLIDKLTGPARVLTAGIRRITQGLTRASSIAGRAAKGFLALGKSFIKASQGFKLSANLRQAGEAVSVVSRKLMTLLKGPINISEEFAAKMTDVRAVMRLAADDPSFKTLTAEAERLGFEIGEFSMTDAARGMEILAVGGQDAAQIMKSLPPMLNLSTSAGMDLAETTDIVLGIMGGFELKVEETARVTDVLAATFTSSKVDLSKLGETFKYASAMSEVAGLTFEETAIVAGLLGNSSIDASVAGTTMVQMWTKLVAQSPKTEKALRRLGVNVLDPLTGELKKPIPLMAEFADAMAGMSNPEVARNLYEVFGVRGLKGGAKLMKALGGEPLRKVTEAVAASAGLNKEIAETKRKTAINETKQMTSALEAMGKVLGDELAPELKWLKALVKDTATDIAHWSRRHPTLTKVLMVTVGAVALLTTLLAGALFTLAAISSLVALIAAPAFLAGAVAVWAFVSPLLLSIGAVALFAIGINLLVAAIAAMIVYKDQIQQWFVDMFIGFGLFPYQAEKAAKATMVFLELLLGPLYAVMNAVYAIIDGWGKLTTLGRGALDLAFGSAVTRQVLGPPTETAGAAGGAGGGRIGGELKIVVESPGAKTTVTDMKTEGAFDLAVETGRQILGF